MIKIIDYSVYDLQDIPQILADTDPTVYDNWSIKRAACWGKIDVVKLLLADSRVDPSADNNWALRFATEYGYTEVANLLKEHPKVKALL